MHRLNLKTAGKTNKELNKQENIAKKVKKTISCSLSIYCCRSWLCKNSAGAYSLAPKCSFCLECGSRALKVGPTHCCMLLGSL